MLLPREICLDTDLWDMLMEKIPLGGEGNRTGQREKLKCDAIAAAFSVRPKGSLS